LKAILCTTSTKQLHNAYYKNYSQLTICVQAANLSDCRIESKFFLPELECSTIWTSAAIGSSGIIQMHSQSHRLHLPEPRLKTAIFPSTIAIVQTEIN